MSFMITPTVTTMAHTTTAELQKRYSLRFSSLSRFVSPDLHSSSQYSSPKGMGSPQNLQWECSGSLRPATMGHDITSLIDKP